MTLGRESFVGSDQTRSCVVIEECDGAYKVSDIETKPLYSINYEQHREALGLWKPSGTSSGT